MKKQSQINSITKRISSGQKSRFLATWQMLHRVVAIFAMVVMCGGAWAQTRDGYYQFKNRYNNTYYLSVSNNNYNNNAATPYLMSSNATGKTGDEAIWAVYSYNGSKILVHATDGRIVVTHNANAGEKRVHLENIDVTNDNNSILFTQTTTTNNGNTYYWFKPNASANNTYLNPHGGNGNDIGLYTSTDDNGNQWTRTIVNNAPTIAAPTISSSDRGRTVSLACTNTYARIYYTTNGTDPTTSSTQYTGSFNITETKTIMAIAYVGFIKADGTFEVVSQSKVTTQQVEVLTTPTTLAFTSNALNMTQTTLSLPSVSLKAGGNTISGTVTYSSNNIGCVNVSNTGVLTVNGAGTATITASYAGNDTYAPSSATMTITVANTAALDETILSDMTITPSSQTLDLGQQVTYTASESLSSKHRTRQAYTTITANGNNYYKVGANYQAAAPITNEDSTPVRFTSFNWSVTDGTAYFTLDPYYSATSNQVTLTRTEQKTASNKTFTISVTGVYGGQNKTATATVTILKTQVNPTAIHPQPADFTLGVGASKKITYTAEPNYDAAGEAYLNITYSSDNTSIATVSADGIIKAVGEGNTTITLQAVNLDGSNGVTATVDVTVLQGTGEDPGKPYYVAKESDFAYIAAHPNYYYVVSSDFNASGNTSITNFSGSFDGGYNTISGLSSALFDNINGGTVKNVRLADVSISGGTDVGALANTATGNAKIYNCGVLSGSVSGSGAVGGIVGRISGQTKVVNNYNYASISGGTYAAGVVGQNAGDVAFSYTEIPNINNWTKNTTNDTSGNWEVNTWSGENDASGIHTPFYQSWRSAGSAISTDIQYRSPTVTLPNGTYIVKFLVRLNNEGGSLNYRAYPNDCATFLINGTTQTVSWTNAEAGNSRIRYANISVRYTVTTGSLQIGLNITKPQNVSWIAFNGFSISAAGTTIATVVANCVNYGTEVSGSNTYPVYGGTDLDNKKNPLYDFFLYDGASYREDIESTNGALPAEARFLNRFEYVRATLNAEKKLAAHYLFNTQNKTDQDEIGKWVLDKEIAPYPVIKPWGKYPSLVNPDVSNRTVGTLSVNISGYGSVSLPISDQLEEEFDYGYHKVQLPYYNDYFNNNYQSNRVVTGWRITSVTGGTRGTFSTTGNNAYNFADRNCTAKDEQRIFAQGGYYYVPEGVTGITIEPYWANDVVYLYDPNIDKVFGMGYSETNFGPTYQPTFNVPAGAKVRNTLRDAHDALTASTNVYDHAIVLIGNVNFRYNGQPLNNQDTKGYTIMSIDEDKDNEPDYAEIYGHVDRRPVPPTRLDFVHQVGISWVKKPMGETLQSYSGIPLTRGHFEITETAFARFTEFETGTHVNRGPLIFNAGLIDQFVTNRDSDNPNIDYAILGGHTYFNAYTPGCQPNSTRKTTLWPTSVTGGEYAEFYLTGMKAEVNVDAQNGRVYTNGGKMGTFAGAYWEQLKGDAYIRFDHTKVGEFFGGSINPAKPITGNIDIIINNSEVEFFCAGPKAGNMTQGKTVTTVANNTKFGTYVGAGYGGSSVARYQMFERVNNVEYINQKTEYFNSFSSNYLNYVTDRGILIRYAVEYMPGSGGMGGSLNPTHVTRFYNDYAQLSLARTYNVTSTLNGCTITGNFYGGPYSGTVGVDGGAASTVTSTLKDCTVGGSVFGGGKSAEIPTITVYPNDINELKTPLYNGQFGVYYQEDEDKFPVYPDGTEYTWVAGERVGNATAKTLGTDVDLTNLGTIFGNTELTIDGGTIAGSVFGAGDASKVTGTTAVTITGNATIANDVYGGANQANVGGNSVVDMLSGSASNIFGANNISGTKEGTVTVNINQQPDNTVLVNNNVYGGGNLAAYTGSPEVNILNGRINENVFGGGLGKSAVVVGNPTVNIGDWINGHSVIIGGDVFGGGDLAAVEGNPTVTIRDCGTLIMGDLYGGGNAAPVYETNTTMWGGTVKGNVFGGGNGADSEKNPNGAQVGYKRDDSTTGGTGNATLNVFGGTIGTWDGEECKDDTGGIFGGSNTKGNIAGTVNLTLDARTCTESGATRCPLKIKEVYGSGNEAAYAGTGINFNLGCVSALSEIYGGAKNADMNGDIHLIISSGHFNRVFGGNNLGGRINGSIKVTIDETGCDPVIIDELYGCGNNAAYSVYGYNEDGTVKTSGTNPEPDPEVNIISFTHIGKVFGGGYGAGAVVAGNPTVNINVIPGEHAADDDGTYLDEHKLGSIGTVFGGGNAANVVGNTSVNIGTESTNAHIAKEGDSDIDTSPKAVGANITGNVYGGGNAADVTGKTNVVVGQPKTTPVTP